MSLLTAWEFKVPSSQRPSVILWSSAQETWIRGWSRQCLVLPPAWLGHAAWGQMGKLGWLQMSFNDTRHALRQEAGLKFALASKVEVYKSFASTREKRQGRRGRRMKSGLLAGAFGWMQHQFVLSLSEQTWGAHSGATSGLICNHRIIESF